MPTRAGHYDRPNLTYRVQRRSDSYSQIRRIIEDHRGESGIVYCIRRADVDTLHDRLAHDGYKVLPYHAGMDDAARKRNQEAFSNEKVDIVVATVAFGMGIDKSNVRYVIHAAMPKSIEHYHQETGRAGRDRLSAECWLLYSYADFMLWKSIIEKSEPEAATIALSKLQDMMNYCERSSCRHKALVSYFGQNYPARSCEACDICLRQMDTMDGAASVAQTIFACVAELGSIEGPTYTTLVLTGSKEARIRSKGHNKLDGYGALASHPANTVRDWIEQLVQQGYLEKTGEYNILILTPKGFSALEGDATPLLARPIEEAPKKTAAQKVSLSKTDAELFELLRRVRRSAAEELAVAPFIVFSDATLREMAARKPSNARSFLAIRGVSQRKLNAFGDTFLAAIRDFMETHPEATRTLQDNYVALARKIAPPKGNIKPNAFELFAEGRSVEDVAKRLNRKPSTVEGYLVEYIEDRGVTDPSPWVDADTVRRILEAAAVTQADRLKPVYEHLNGEVSYTQIRVCLMCQRNAG